MYECDKCKKEFKKKPDYERHKNRKFPCKQQIYICNDCNTEFTYKSALMRHQKSRCSNDKYEEVVLCKNNEDNDVNKIEELLREFKSTKQKMRIIEGKITDIVKTHNIDLSDEFTQNKTTNVQNNITNNITNNTQNNSINIINVINTDKSKIRKFGEEDLSYITNEEYLDILGKGFRSPHELVEYIHFNKNQPQNHNVYISNLRSNIARVHDGKKWIIQPLNETIDQLIDDNTDRLLEAFDKLGEELEEKKKKKFKNFKKRRNDGDIVTNMKQSFINISYSHSPMIKKTYMKKYKIEK